jgi:hypothetical protein
MRKRKFRLIAVMSLVALSTLSLPLSGCSFPPVGSPAWHELTREYEMGCRPEDAEGYEKLFVYCHKRD